MSIITKYNLNFVVEDYGNPKLIVMSDLSQYPESPDNPLLCVTLPGFDKHIELKALPNKQMILNSNLLGFTNNVQACDLHDLPDGLWKLTYMVCPYDELFHTVHFFKTSKVQHDFDTLLSELELNNNGNPIDVDSSQYEDIFLLLESCKACARLGYSKKAMVRYEAVIQLITQLKNKTNG